MRSGELPAWRVGDVTLPGQLPCSWVDKPPDGWRRALAPNGREYFYNKDTGEKLWGRDLATVCQTMDPIPDAVPVRGTELPSWRVDFLADDREPQEVLGVQWEKVGERPPTPPNPPPSPCMPPLDSRLD